MVHTAQEYLGSFRLLNLVRTGKTCQIWEAIDERKSERRALKVLFSELITDRAEIAYLKHEYQVASKLEHPRVIRIYEYGAERGNVFLAMEMCPGSNLKQALLQSADFLAANLTDIVQQSAEGLAYFHEQGWVHRDIKPDNFMLKPSGEVKLIDFALAQRPSGFLSRLLPSRAGKIQGTRSYMSPEQIRGQSLDARADIYSFGCMVHELVSGRPPFTGVSTNDLLMKHLNSPAPSLLASGRSVSENFANLVRRMVAKQPKDRPATMQDVVRNLKSTPIFKEAPFGRS